MSYQVLSELLNQNLNRVINLNLHLSPEKLLQFLFTVKEDRKIKNNELDINQLTEFEYRNWFENIFYMKYLNDFLTRDVIEIIVHSPSDVQLFALNCKTEKKDFPLSLFDFNLSLDIFSTIQKKQFSFESPFCSFQSIIAGFECRLSMAHKSINKSFSHKLYCRKVSNKTLPLVAFQNNPSVDKIIQHLIKNKLNVLISGATASGKTSFIRSILSRLNKEEHLVIIEDIKELDIRSHNTTHLISREGQPDDIKNFCNHLLRMRPDRVILGEIRAEEVIPLLLNLNCGHKGLFATIHANTAVDTIERIATLIAIYGKNLSISYTQTINLICQNIDFIIYMQDGKIHEIINILGNQDQNVHYEKIY